MADTQAAWQDIAPKSFAIGADYNAWQDIAPKSFAIGADYNAWQDIPPATLWSLPANVPTRQVYTVTLRKNALDDLEVPATSLQIRRRDGRPTYVLAVIPNAPVWRDAVQSYKDGDIIIRAGSITGDGTRHLSELTRAGLESIVFDQGVQSASLSLSGYRIHATGNPRPVNLTGINVYTLQADGRIRVRCPVNMFLRPGDTAVFTPGPDEPEESMVVEMITILIHHRSQRMDVTGG